MTAFDKTKAAFDKTQAMIWLFLSIQVYYFPLETKDAATLASRSVEKSLCLTKNPFL